MYYVYEWIIDDNNEVFYVGKGILSRTTELTGRNKRFLHINGLIIKRLSDESVETKGDECNPVELEIDTNSKCEALK